MRGRGWGLDATAGHWRAPSSPLSHPARRPAHLVDVAIGPGPHALQQLEAVSWVLQRHIPQQRHGPAPGGPAGGRARAAEQPSRRGAARGGVGRGGSGWLRGRGGGARARGGAGPGRGCPPPSREEAPAGQALGGQGKPRGELTVPRPFRQPPIPSALQVGSLEARKQRGRSTSPARSNPNFPD